MSILEKARSHHEDIELIEDAVSRLLLIRSKGSADVPVDHAVDFLCRETEKKSLSLMHIDSFPSDEFSNMDGASSSDVWHQFYSRIRHAKETAKQDTFHVDVCLEST